jgi:dolichol-phosphate mannosyltransferase
MDKALVVIPTYNEADNIQRVVPDVLHQSEKIDVLVVDDNSPDGTAQLVKEMIRGNDRVHLIERERKMGLGTAYVAGFRFAIERSYSYVFEMDADFSHDPGALPGFLEKAGECDLVIGSRYINGVRVLNWPIQRLLLSYFANVYTRIVTGLPLKDATGGFKCYKRAVLEAIDLDAVKSNGYAFQIEMSFRAWKKGYRLEEIPIVFLDRRSGSSKMSRSIVYEAFFLVWSLRLRSMFGKL